MQCLFVARTTNKYTSKSKFSPACTKEPEFRRRPVAPHWPRMDFTIGIKERDFTRFNKIATQGKIPRQVDKEAIGLSRVQQCSSMCKSVLIDLLDMTIVRSLLQHATWSRCKRKERTHCTTTAGRPTAVCPSYRRKPSSSSIWTSASQARRLANCVKPGRFTRCVPTSRPIIAMSVHNATRKHALR